MSPECVCGEPDARERACPVRRAGGGNGAGETRSPRPLPTLLRPLQHDEPLDLYEVFRQRYERGAMIITSNRALDEWGPLFKDELLASAAVDRLLHHSHVLIMEGETYRNPRSRRRHPDAANGSA